jgi:hypothetical protein
VQQSEVSGRQSDYENVVRYSRLTKITFFDSDFPRAERSYVVHNRHGKEDEHNPDPPGDKTKVLIPSGSSALQWILAEIEEIEEGVEDNDSYRISDWLPEHPNDNIYREDDSNIMMRNMQVRKNFGKYVLNSKADSTVPDVDGDEAGDGDIDETTRLGLQTSAKRRDFWHVVTPVPSISRCQQPAQRERMAPQHPTTDQSGEGHRRRRFRPSR